MKLKWYGHASFRITANDGTSIITDPYTPETSGYLPFTETADIVVMSSDNDSFHCRYDLIPGEPIVVDALKLARGAGECTEKGIRIQAIEAMEALDHPEHEPDQNGMYRFEVDGIKFGHLGDVGNPLTANQMAFFKGVDVLFALAGGLPTIKLPDLKDVIDFVKPKLVVPMHFRTLGYAPRNTFWIETFLSFFDEKKDVDFAIAYEVELTPADLPDETRVLVLDYVR